MVFGGVAKAAYRRPDGLLVASAAVLGPEDDVIVTGIMCAWPFRDCVVDCIGYGAHMAFRLLPDDRRSVSLKTMTCTMSMRRASSTPSSAGASSRARSGERRCAVVARRR